MAESLWDQAKKKFDDAVAIGAYAANEWTTVVTLHKTPGDAIKAIEKKAAELANARAQRRS